MRRSSSRSRFVPPRYPDSGIDLLTPQPAAPAEPAPPSPPSHDSWQPGPFDHQRLDAFVVAREALVRGEAIARALPSAYATLTEQLRGALLRAHLGVAQAAGRAGSDRVARFRTARAEAAAAAAALDAIVVLELAPGEDVAATVTLLGRLCAMLVRLESRAGR